MSQELTRETIIQAARTQFIESGYEHVSMRSIAKQLGCSHGAIYYHFKNKAALFYSIVEFDFARLNDKLEEVVNGSKEQSTKLFHLFFEFIKFGLNNQNQYEIMFIARNSKVDSLSQEAANVSYQKFANAVQLLSNKTLAVKDVWSAFLSLHGFVSHYISYVDRFDEAELAAKQHVQFVLKNLLE